MNIVTLLDRNFEFVIINGSEHYYELDSESKRGSLFTSIPEIFSYFKNTPSYLLDKVGMSGYIQRNGGWVEFVNIIGVHGDNYYISTERGYHPIPTNEIKIIGVDITEKEARKIKDDMNDYSYQVSLRNTLTSHLINVNAKIDSHLIVFNEIFQE